jgi:hypothetical protein
VGDENTPAFSTGFIFRRFLVPAIFLVAIPFPLYLLIQYKAGEWIDVFLLLMVWVLCVLAYWLPIGVFCSAGKPIGPRDFSSAIWYQYRFTFLPWLRVCGC